MWRTFLRWTAPLFLTATCLLPAAQAQRGTSDNVGSDIRSWRREATAEELANRTFALPYTVAAITLLLMLVIVCTPSRKMLRED